MTKATYNNKRAKQKKKINMKFRAEVFECSSTSYCTDSNYFCAISFQDSTHESLHIIPISQIKDIEIVKDVSIIPLYNNDT